MKNIELGSDGLHEKRTATRDIAYTPEFKKFIAENGGLFSAFSLIEQIEQELNTEMQDQEVRDLYNEWYYAYGDQDYLVEKPRLIGKIFEKNGCKVNLELTKGSNIYKVTVGDHNFFVKREPIFRINYTKMGGYKEIKASAKLKDLVKDIPDLSVIDFKLGYEDKKRSVRYFVAEWQRDLPVLADYLHNNPNIPEEKTEELKRRVNKLELFFRGKFVDIQYGNMFYDPKTDKIIIFDVNLF